MPWRGHNGAFCHGCGKHRDEVGPLSARYKCAACGEAAMIENHRELVAHAGPRFAHWRRRTLAAFGIVAVDTDRDAA